MNSYILGAVYVAIGLIAAASHWAKKRYYDKTTACGYFEYMVGAPGATKNALSVIIVAEAALSATHLSGMITFTEFLAAWGAGYISDSTFNRAPL